MKRPDPIEQDLLAAYESDLLKSISPTDAEHAKFKEAASATILKERRLNKRIPPQI